VHWLWFHGVWRGASAWFHGVWTYLV